MGRDPRKLRVFVLADELVAETYRATQTFPLAERFGLRVQIRQAAVSAASNIVEGCARRSTKEYLYFLNVSTGSAAETRYLVDLAQRLGFVPAGAHQALTSGYTELMKGLQKLINSLAGSA